MWAFILHGAFAAFLVALFRALYRAHKIQGGMNDVAKGSFRDAKAVLFVTAHPDDETMFFAPTILNLIASGISVHLLCLSNGKIIKIEFNDDEGGHDGLGEIREKELEKAALKLGFQAENVQVLADQRLQDGPENKWPASIIKEHVEMMTKVWKIDTVIQNI